MIGSVLAEPVAFEVARKTEERPVSMGFTQIPTLCLSWLLSLMPFAASVQDPDLEAMRAQSAATEAFAIERAHAALEEGDPRRAMIAVIAFAHGRGSWMEAVLADEPEAIARKRELERLAGEAIALAQARGAADPVVQLQLALACDQPWANCDADAAIERLAALEPDNGLAAAIALRRAYRVKDAAGQRAALKALASAMRFDSHEAAVLSAARAFAEGGRPPAALRFGEFRDLTAEDRRAMVALTLWLVAPSTAWFPEGLGTRCQAETVADDDRADCIAALRVLSGGDALVVHRIGLAMLEGLIDDPDERARIRARRRDLDWQASAFGELTRELGRSPGSVAAHVDATIAAGGELALQTKRLSEAGIPLVAPADWTPSDPRLRD